LSQIEMSVCRNRCTFALEKFNHLRIKQR
jgi:hypothetical protein